MIGHNKQQTFFKQAYMSGQLSHAYLLTGPEGVGKKLFAKTFAKGLLCEHKSFFTNCECTACKQAENNMHPDYHIYEDKEEDSRDEKSNLCIESVRQIAEDLTISAFSGGWRTVIIDNVHVLCLADASAANALLKTLEEPGINTVFLLITHKLDKILPTIRSRCVNMPFEPLLDCELAVVLKNRGIEPDPILPYAAGSMSMALALTDIDVNELVSSLVDKSLDKLGRQILAMNDKNTFFAAVSVIQGYFLKIYKYTLNSEIAAFLQYMGNVLKNLAYNVNMPLLLLDFYVKLTDTITSAEIK